MARWRTEYRRNNLKVDVNQLLASWRYFANVGCW